MTARIVVDTNVLASGLLRAGGPPGRIVDLILRESFRVLFDDRILDEYTRVLPRPKFSFGPADVSALLSFVRDAGERVLAPPLAQACSDPFDRPFLEVAVAAQADALVTGNRRHFPRSCPVRILEPAEFLQIDL